MLEDPPTEAGWYWVGWKGEPDQLLGVVDVAIDQSGQAVYQLGGFRFRPDVDCVWHDVRAQPPEPPKERP